MFKLFKVTENENRNMFYIKIVLVIFAAIMFFLVTMTQGTIIGLCGNYYVICSFLSFIFLIACSIFILNKEVNNLIMILFVFVAVGLLLLIRGSLLYYKGGDYATFLLPWMKSLGESPGISGLAQNIGDYNMPYLYILLIISKLFHIDMDIFILKIVSISFDVMIAYYAMKLISLKTQNIYMRLLTFLSVFAIPTVMINGAMWGQCDSIYTALATAAVYYAMIEKSKRAYIFVGLAFSFKLQTVFILPMFIVFIILKKIKIRDAYLFFVSFFVSLLPALIAGKPFIDTVSIYWRQAGQYPMLTLNLPNIYTLVGDVSFENFNAIGIFLAGLAVISMIYFVYVNRFKITALPHYIYISFLFTLIIPYLLPRMHDRYFFMADVFSLLVFLCNKRRWFVPVIVISSSYFAYAGFITNYHSINYIYLSIALLFVIVVTLKDLVNCFLFDKKITRLI